MNKVLVLGVAGAIGATAVSFMLLSGRGAAAIGAEEHGPPVESPAPRAGTRAARTAVTAPPVHPAEAPPETTADEALRRSSLAVWDALRYGITEKACMPVLGELARLMLGAPEGSALAAWSASQVQMCAEAMTGLASRRALLEPLLAAKPNEPGLLRASAWSEASAGNFESAVDHLERLVEVEQAPSDLDFLGGTALMYAETLPANDPRRVQLLKRAQAALARAIEMSSVPEPWMYERMARVMLGRGDAREALNWIARIDGYAHERQSSMSQFSLASLYFGAGKVYYKAGQAALGIAYMDQGIRLAPIEFQEDFISSKRAVLEGRI